MLPVIPVMLPVIPVMLPVIPVMLPVIPVMFSANTTLPIAGTSNIARAKAIANDKTKNVAIFI
jgi:hypothetical protein